MCSTIGETLKKVFECVIKLLEKGVLPKYIAVITYYATEAMMVRKFIEKESGKKIEVTGAGEQKDGEDSVVIDETTTGVSRKYAPPSSRTLHANLWLINVFKEKDN